MDLEKITAYLDNPRNVDLYPIDKKTWQTLIRLTRRKFYDARTDEEKKALISAVWNSRVKKDYQGFATWKSKWPEQFV
jgi:hypothetical protein